MQALEELAEIQACSLTCDLWTARTFKSYITVTCHFIDDSLKMKSYVLATNHVEVSHTAENVAQELKKVASEWKISNKITVTMQQICGHPKLGGYRSDNELSRLQSKCRETK